MRSYFLSVLLATSVLNTRGLLAGLSSSSIGRASVSLNFRFLGFLLRHVCILQRKEGSLLHKGFTGYVFQLHM